MEIKEFVENFKNHPVMFIGTGLSLRYLKNSYTWDSLLHKIALDFKNDEYYLDLKSKCFINKEYAYDKIASSLEADFNKCLEENRNGTFKNINDKFYENMRVDINVSRFKLYIAEIFKNIEFRDEKLEEIAELVKARKNVGSVITTNYDCMIEEIFSFKPLIGNDILLSNPYGSVYKIHGCVSRPDKIIITEGDYSDFENRYELIRAQLLSLFIHNPIIFIGYNIGDKNIKGILKTIFSYVDYNSETAQKIRDNFLLVEYEKNFNNTEVFEHDIDIEGFPTIRINRLRTDNFIALYQALSNIMLPVSAMGIRKVQNIVKEIYSGGEIIVSITSDLDTLKNSDTVLVVGSKNTINYEFQTISEIMTNYFKIIDESNSQLLKLMNKQKIQSAQYFPVYAFSKISNEIDNVEKLKKQQRYKISSLHLNGPNNDSYKFKSPYCVENDIGVPNSNKTYVICKYIINGEMDLAIVEDYLRNYKDKYSTNYRKILCCYDFKKYSGEDLYNF